MKELNKYQEGIDIDLSKSGASKTVSFAFTFSEINFELTDLTVQDVTPAPVTSSTPKRNKEKCAIDINEAKIYDTSKELL